MKPMIIVIFILMALFLIGWVGLQVSPRPFGIPDLPQSDVKSIPLPAGLPAPVERFYRTVYGEQIPVIKSVVLTGRGRIRPFGVWLPARFVMVHNTGKDYRHYFEATFFGIPFIKVNEGYVDGKSFFESPMGTYYDDPNTNQGANLALWAEGGWFPALWLTDARARWQAVDDHTALLFVPFENGEENFIVRFNPETGLVDLTEAMRYKAPHDKSKALWITTEERPENQPTVSYATWLDTGKPWAALRLEEINFNLDVSAYLQARGQ